MVPRSVYTREVAEAQAVSRDVPNTLRFDSAQLHRASDLIASFSYLLSHFNAYA